MVLSEADVRRRLTMKDGLVVRLAPGDVVTPAAKDFMREHGMLVEIDAGIGSEMGQTVIPPKGPKRYVDVTGKVYDEKPEHMTHLRGNILIEKSHPRIALRGRLDSLQAKIIETRIRFAAGGESGPASDLDEILEYVREILAAEVRETPFARKTLLDMDATALRDVSHNPRPHFGIGHLVPDAAMGIGAAAVNSLRALSREAELAGIAAFVNGDGEGTRPDLLLALNRLSSALYILICRLRSGFYGSRNHEH